MNFFRFSILIHRLHQGAEVLQIPAKNFPSVQITDIQLIALL